MVGPSVWSPCAICDGTGDRSKNRNYRDGWSAALAESQADLDRMAAYDQRQQQAISEYAAELARFRTPATSTAVRDRDIEELVRSLEHASKQQDEAEAALAVSKTEVARLLEELAAARAQGAQLMRDAVLRWHDEQRVKYRDLSGPNAFAGAYMSAHERSIAAISALAARELPGGHHPYVPHPKYPWFCRDCGYPEHERLKHEQSIAAISALNVDKGEQ